MTIKFTVWVLGENIIIFFCSTVNSPFLSVHWHNFVKCFSSDVTAQISPINFSGSGRVLKLS